MDTSKKYFACLMLLMFCGRYNAQGNKYFIDFRNKTGTPFSVSRPEEFLTQASIDRRARYNISYHFTDLPVTPSYITQVDAVPHTIVRFASKWMNGVVVSFDDPANEAAALAEIEALPFVKSRSKVRRYRSDAWLPDSTHGNRTRSLQGTNAFDYGGSADQATQLNIPCLHEKGFRGQGMVIAVLDAGFHGIPQNFIFDSLLASGRLLGTRDFVSGGTNVFQGGEHGTGVMSCLAALVPGVAMGTAPLASYWLMRTEEGGAETISEEYNWIRGAEFADSVGCDILTTSLGYNTFDDPSQNHTYASLNGRTAPMSIAGTWAARKGMFVLNAAGNEGDKPWHYISVPGDADSICTVGSVKSDGIRSPFSSVGPTSDGRIKPDLMACGENAWVCNGNGACFPANGTSFATPVLAGAVACYWQANRKLDNMRLMTRLKNSANNRKEPNNEYGWGIPNVCAAVNNALEFTTYSKPGGLVVQIEDADFEYINVQLIDMQGKLISTAETTGSELKMGFEMPHLPAGVYIIQVESSSGKKSKKVLRLDL